MWAVYYRGGKKNIVDQEEVRIVRVYEIHIVGSKRELDGIFRTLIFLFMCSLESTCARKLVR